MRSVIHRDPHRSTEDSTGKNPKRGNFYNFNSNFSLGYLPVDIGRAGQGSVLGGSTLGDLEGAAHLVEAQSCAQVQAQCLSDLTHGDSVRWHWVHL